MKKLIVTMIVLSWLWVSIFAFAQDVAVIYLRQPTKKTDVRYDPFYELGINASFGITRCHRSNLMHPDRVYENLVGKRAAFFQGGVDPKAEISQIRLVFMTDLIEEENIEIIGTNPESRVAILKWNGEQQLPLQWNAAPVIASNDGSGIPNFIEIGERSRRGTIVGGIASHYRTRVAPVSEEIAADIIHLWEKSVSKINPEFATHYFQTLASPKASLIDRNREASFWRFHSLAGQGSCGAQLGGLEASDLQSPSFGAESLE